MALAADASRTNSTASSDLRVMQSMPQLSHSVTCVVAARLVAARLPRPPAHLLVEMERIVAANLGRHAAHPP
jgi:hypothetical protein